MAEATITIIGNLTRDPELKFLDKSGTATVKIGVAVTRKWKDKQGAEMEQTSFFDATAYGTLAQNIADSLVKGDRVVVTGQQEQRTWETDKGEKRSTFEIKIEGCGPDLRFRSLTGSQPRATQHHGTEDAF